jgi:regulator of sigma D
MLRRYLTKIDSKIKNAKEAVVKIFQKGDCCEDLKISEDKVKKLDKELEEIKKEIEAIYDKLIFTLNNNKNK